MKVRTGLGLLAKGAITSIAALVGLAIGGAIASAIGIQEPAMPQGLSMEAMLGLMFILGSLFYVLFGLFFKRLEQSKTTTFLLCLFFHFVVVSFLNALEGKYFTTIVSLPYSLISQAVQSLGVAICVTLLFKSDNPGPSFPRAFAEWISRFGKASLSLRLIVSWLSFIIIYFAMGMIVGPVVLPYYQSAPLGLQIPPMQTIVSLQLFRGALILLVSLPLIALWKHGRLSFFLWFGLILFYKDVILGVLAGSWFPWILRITHGLELTADSFLLAGVYGFLLVAAMRKSNTLVGSQEEAVRQ